MRILLIEDSPRILRALRDGLLHAGYEVDSAADGHTGQRVAEQRPYDVIVLDLMLPQLDGWQVLDGLRARGCAAHVLVLTALGTVEDRVRGLRAGADDYLVKPFSFDELLARIQALTRRKYGAKSPVLRIADLEVDTVARSVRRAGHAIVLTHREYRLIELLALREGQIVTRSEIEEHLYGSRSLALSNVVDSAICALRAKLKRHGEPPLIHTRPRLGYVLADGAP